MKRPSITLSIIVVAIIAVSAYAVWKYLPGRKTSTNSNSSPTNSTRIINVDLNANVAVPITTAPKEVKGNTEFSGSVTTNGVQVVFSSLQRQNTVDAVKADSGKTFLLLYFDAIAPSDVKAVNNGFVAGAHLRQGKNIIPLEAIFVAPTNVKNSRGYLKFQVPPTAKLQLEIGSGTTAQHVAIPS